MPSQREPDWDAMPTPDELRVARRTVDRLASAIIRARVDIDYGEMWGGLVEGKRMIAVATSWLGTFRPEYQAAWDGMMEDEG